MKLYYMTGSCSLAPHIALREAGAPFSLVRMEKKTHQLEDGRGIEAVNPRAYVPVLELDDGRRLFEVSAILQYIADLKPEKKLAPPQGFFERYELMGWLNFIATEVHKGFWPYFHEGCEAERPTVGERLKTRLTLLDQHLASRPFVTGDTFTVADAYLLTVVNWIRPAGLDPSAWPQLSAYRARLRERPSIHAALDAEGLLKRG